MSALPRMTVERLHQFDDAWAGKDLDALMQFMTDDCEYRASVGPGPGKVYVGKAQVRKGFRDMLAHDAALQSQPGKLYVYGDRGVAEWSYVESNAAGRQIIVRGCDLFEFVGNKIRLKDAFRKCRG